MSLHPETGKLGTSSSGHSDGRGPRRTNSTAERHRADLREDVRAEELWISTETAQPSGAARSGTAATSRTRLGGGRRYPEVLRLDSSERSDGGSGKADRRWWRSVADRSVPAPRSARRNDVVGAGTRHP